MPERLTLSCEIEGWLVVTERKGKAVFCSERSNAAEVYAIDNRGKRYALVCLEDCQTQVDEWVADVLEMQQISSHNAAHSH
jgi:hypothetical protein